MFHAEKEGDCSMGLPLKRLEDRCLKELRTGVSLRERGRLFDGASF